jgi:hypothetical protein
MGTIRLTFTMLDAKDNLSLGLTITLDIPCGRPKACMTGELLDVAERAANLADFPGCMGDKRPTPAVRGTPDHPKVRVKAMKPHGDRSRRQVPVTLAVDDRPIRTGLINPLSLESYERSFDIGVHRDHCPGAALNATIAVVRRPVSSTLIPQNIPDMWRFLKKNLHTPSLTVVGVPAVR